LALDGLLPPLLVLLAGAVAVLGRRALARRAGATRRRADVASTVLVVACALLLELAMGRPVAYRNGPLRVWSGDVESDQNSQQLADPYSLTHVIHGAAFYALTRAVAPGAAVATRLLAATTLEAAWETYENTDTVIDRYRAATISLGYYGDSLVNSLGDVLACLLGFWLARRLPVRATIAWVVCVELALAWWIRDNLTLNILMLIHPLDVVRRWQMGSWRRRSRGRRT